MCVDELCLLPTIKEHYFDLALFIHLQIDFIFFFSIVLGSLQNREGTAILASPRPPHA